MGEVVYLRRRPAPPPPSPAEAIVLAGFVVTFVPIAAFVLACLSVDRALKRL